MYGDCRGEESELQGWMSGYSLATQSNMHASNQPSEAGYCSWSVQFAINDNLIKPATGVVTMATAATMVTAGI